MCLRFSYLSCGFSQQALHSDPLCGGNGAPSKGPLRLCIYMCAAYQYNIKLCVKFLPFQSGSPATCPKLINQMPCWGSSAQSFTSLGPWVITKHHHPGARATPLHHCRFSQASSGISRLLWDYGHNSCNCWHYNEWVFNSTQCRKTLGNVGIIRVDY